MDEDTYFDILEREAERRNERAIADYESQYARHRGYDE